MNASDPSTVAADSIESATREGINSLAFQMIIISLALVQGVLGIAVYRGWIWLAVPLVLVASHLMHGLLIGFHEASHGLLRRSRRLNEFDGVVIGVLSLMSFSLYRAAHQSHHMHLASEKDVELWPFVDPRSPRWARRLAAFLELTFGFLFTPFLFLRAFFRKGSTIRNRKVRRRIWGEIVLMIAVWTAIIVTVSLLRLWTYFLWLYLVPAWLAGNLQSWRKYIEHVGLVGDSVNGSTRSIIADGWAGKFFSLSLLHEPYHGVHHHRAGIPHDALPRYAAVLQPGKPGEMAPFPNYRSALGHLLRNLADPRVGAQWLKTENSAAPQSLS